MSAESGWRARMQKLPRGNRDYRKAPAVFTRRVRENLATIRASADVGENGYGFSIFEKLEEV